MRTLRTSLLILLGFLALCFTLTVRYSAGRLLWSDEILATVLVTDPSFTHMLQAWRAGTDGGGLSFYLLARLWAHLFGSSALALRLFSSAGVAVGCTALVRLLTPFVRLRLALFSTLFVCFSSDVLLWQLMQFRFYGMLFGLTALAALLAVRPLPHAYARRFALANFAVHSLLASTHPFGLVYSATLIAATVLAGLRDRSPLHRALPALLAWWVVPVSLPALRASAAVTRPHFWTSAPTLANLLDALTAYSLPTGILLGCLSTLTLLLLLVTRPRPRLTPPVPSAPRLRLVLLALFAVPLLVWLLAQLGTSLFVDRYLVPTLLAITALLALQIHLVLSRIARRLPAALTRPALPLAGFALLLWTGYIAAFLYPSYAAYPSRSRADLLHTLQQTLPRDLPIVIEPPDLFTELRYSSPDPRLHPTFALDWPLAIAPDAQRGEASAFHELEHWRQLGYFPGSVRQSTDLLTQTNRFAVLDVASLHWLEHRLTGNPAWQLTQLPAPAPAAPGLRLWLVCRRGTPGCGASSAATR